jgi:hypothetical protein
MSDAPTTRIRPTLIVGDRLPTGATVAYHGSLTEKWGIYEVVSCNGGRRMDGTAGHILSPVPYTHDGLILRGVAAESCTVLPNAPTT